MIALDEHEINMIPRVGASAFALYCYIKSQADEFGKCSPSYLDMRKATGLSANTIHKGLQLLRASGMIEVKRNFDAASTYTVVHYLNNRGALPRIMRCTTANNEVIASLTTTTTINPNYIDSIKSSSKTHSTSINEVVKNRFDIQDAQAVITRITHWPRIPGNQDEALHALGVVIDIHDKQGDETETYLRKFWDKFRERYPHSTRLFWLTDWAVQGKIPDNKSEKKTEEVPARVLARQKLEAENA